MLKLLKKTKNKKNRRRKNIIINYAHKYTVIISLKFKTNKWSEIVIFTNKIKTNKQNDNLLMHCCFAHLYGFLNVKFL